MIGTVEWSAEVVLVEASTMHNPHGMTAIAANVLDRQAKSCIVASWLHGPDLLMFVEWQCRRAGSYSYENVAKGQEQEPGRFVE